MSLGFSSNFLHNFVQPCQSSSNQIQIEYGFHARGKPHLICIWFEKDILTRIKINLKHIYPIYISLIFLKGWGYSTAPNKRFVMRSMKRDHKSGKNAHFCTYNQAVRNIILLHGHHVQCNVAKHSTMRFCMKTTVTTDFHSTLVDRHTEHGGEFPHLWSLFMERITYTA